MCAGCAQLLRSCLTLNDPMDYSPPGSKEVDKGPWDIQARILEWVVISVVYCTVVSTLQQNDPAINMQIFTSFGTSSPFR